MKLKLHQKYWLCSLLVILQYSMLTGYQPADPIQTRHLLLHKHYHLPLDPMIDSS